MKKLEGLRKILIVPGNGGGSGSVELANWYGWARRTLEEHFKGEEVKVMALDMPDPYDAHMSFWLPFLEERSDEHTLVIGHSSGAEAAMRLAEKKKLWGVALVAACITDLGNEHERDAGWYSDPWLWDQIKLNAPRRWQFGSRDDPFIPFEEEQLQVATLMETQFTILENRGHICQQTLPELVEVIKKATL